MTLSPASFDYVRTLVHRESAIVLTPGKEYLVESRLIPLAREAGIGDVAAFVDAQRTRPDRRISLRIVEALTTNETSWMRDGDPFAALTGTVVPALAATRGSTRSLRIWSAACSSGQEAYSIAMLLADCAPVRGWRIELVGTDLSEEMVKRARAGRYSQLEVNRGLPASLLVRHFTRAGTEWQVSDQLRATARFTTMNLAAPFPALGQFDVVFLRNVLIYFDLPTKRAILQRVRSVLRPDGYLFLGAAEMTLGVDDSWERVPMGRSAAYRLVKGQ